MASVTNGGAVFREGFEGVAGNEPGRFDVVFCEEFEEALHTDGAGEETAGYLWKSVVSEVVEYKQHLWSSRLM